jgi:hypothetical protein
VQQIYLGDRGKTIGAPEKIRGREMSPGYFDRLLGRAVSKAPTIRGYFSSQLTCGSFPIMFWHMLRLLLIMMTLLMVQVAHVQPVHATMDIDQNHMNDATHCVNDDVSMSDHMGSEVSDHCDNAHFSCSMSGSSQFNAKHVPSMWARMVHPSGDPRFTLFKIERPPKA